MTLRSFLNLSDVLTVLPVAGKCYYLLEMHAKVVGLKHHSVYNLFIIVQIKTHIKETNSKMLMMEGLYGYIVLFLLFCITKHFILVKMFKSSVKVHTHKTQLHYNLLEIMELSLQKECYLQE